MEFKEVVEDDLRKTIPGTLAVFHKYDDMASQLNAHLTVRDSDHTYGTLRYCIYPNEGTMRSNAIIELESRLCKEVSATCCRCGSQKCVKHRHGDDKFDWSEKFILCDECYKQQLLEDNPHGVIEMLRKYGECTDDNIARLKVKVLLDSGIIEYPRIKDLRYTNGKLYINKGFALFRKPVKLLGIYTGRRDVTNERVYEDEIVVFGYDFTSEIHNDFYLHGRKEDYCWNTVMPMPDFVSSRYHDHWGVDHRYNGFNAVPWDMLINPIVVGYWSETGTIIPRKIGMPALDAIDSSTKEHVIENIRRFENESNTSVLI